MLLMFVINRFLFRIICIYIYIYIAINDIFNIAIKHRVISILSESDIMPVDEFLV